MNKKLDKERIDKLEKCIRNKDKRIKKIEEYFKLRNKLILSVLWSLLFALLWLLFFLYAERVPDGMELPLTVIIFSVIGVAACVIGTIFIWMFGMDKIWPNW